MTDFYHSGHRALPQEFESTALAKRLEELIVRPELDAEAQAFIQNQDHFFLTTVDQKGFPTVSYKGGNQGFVKVVNETTCVSHAMTAMACGFRWATLQIRAR